MPEETWANVFKSHNGASPPTSSPWPSLIQNFNLHVNAVNFHIIKIHETWESNELKLDTAITDVYKEF
jgi:hypothetical protein